MESLTLSFEPMIESSHTVLISTKLSYEMQPQPAFHADAGRARPKRKCTDKCHEAFMAFSRFNHGVHQHRGLG